MAKHSIKLRVDVGNDKHGLPVVTWLEPRIQYKSFLSFRWTEFPSYHARCWIDIDDGTGQPMFSMHHDGDHSEPGMVNSTQLSNVAGFSVHTSIELYGDGATPIPRASQDPDSKNYRDALVLVADLKIPARPNLPPIFPLTLTTAARSDVMALHAVLTDVFLVNANAMKPALTARLEKLKRSALQKKWEEWLKPPILSGGRKFVDLWDPGGYEPDDAKVMEIDAEDEFGIFGDEQQKDCRFVTYLHFFERKQHSVLERAMVLNCFWICDKSDSVFPELIKYACVNSKGVMSGYKPRNLFKAVRLFNGSELQLPEAYIATSDVKIDASTLILCLEFSDGELMPLTHAPASERAGVEKMRDQMEHIFSGEESGGGNGGAKIVL